MATIAFVRTASVEVEGFKRLTYKPTNWTVDPSTRESTRSEPDNPLPFFVAELLTAHAGTTKRCRERCLCMYRQALCCGGRTGGLAYQAEAPWQP